MKNTTTVSKDYDPPNSFSGPDVSVTIDVEGNDGSAVLEMADILREAVGEAHAEAREGRD